jgi:hypothetical protein
MLAIKSTLPASSPSSIHCGAKVHFRFVELMLRVFAGGIFRKLFNVFILFFFGVAPLFLYQSPYPNIAKITIARNKVN